MSMSIDPKRWEYGCHGGKVDVVLVSLVAGTASPSWMPHARHVARNTGSWQYSEPGNETGDESRLPASRAEDPFPACLERTLANFAAKLRDMDLDHSLLLGSLAAAAVALLADRHPAELLTEALGRANTAERTIEGPGVERITSPALDAGRSRRLEDQRPSR